MQGRLGQSHVVLLLVAAMLATSCATSPSPTESKSIFPANGPYGDSRLLFEAAASGELTQAASILPDAVWASALTVMQKDYQLPDGLRPDSPCYGHQSLAKKLFLDSLARPDVDAPPPELLDTPCRDSGDGLAMRSLASAINVWAEAAGAGFDPRSYDDPLGAEFRKAFGEFMVDLSLARTPLVEAHRASLEEAWLQAEAAQQKALLRQQEQAARIEAVRKAQLEASKAAVNAGWWAFRSEGFCEPSDLGEAIKRAEAMDLRFSVDDRIENGVVVEALLTLETLLGPVEARFLRGRDRCAAFL